MVGVSGGCGHPLVHRVALSDFESSFNKTHETLVLQEINK